MKKLIVLFFLATGFSVHGQTADEKETLKNLNENIISLYRSRKFDEAVKAAQRAVDLNIKIYGLEQRETAVAYSNLGVIHRERRKFKDSIENLRKAVEIYQKIPNANGADIVSAYEALALTEFFDGRTTEAETSYLKTIEIAESKFGKESKESFMPTLNLASIYARGGKIDEAHAFYLKAYALAIKNFGKESEEIERIGDSRVCSANYGKNADVEKSKAFEQAKNSLFGTNGEEKARILNGKAVSLPQPAYPAEAKEQRLSGTASIKVKIDEQGDVVEAKSICRSDVLGRAAEEAARKAKFSPTLKDGAPVRVTGIITYNFIL